MLAVSQLFYVSVAARPYDSEAIQDILRSARRNNATLDITGCLLYSGRHFAQVLEGPAAVVASLALRIADDARHLGLQILMETHRVDREYGDWSMGYLHDAGLQQDLETLARAGASDPGVVADVMARMKPDTVMGALA